MTGLTSTGLRILGGLNLISLNATALYMYLVLEPQITARVLEQAEKIINLKLSISYLSLWISRKIKNLAFNMFISNDKLFTSNFYITIIHLFRPWTYNGYTIYVKNLDCLL